MLFLLDATVLVQKNWYFSADSAYLLLFFLANGSISIGSLLLMVLALFFENVLGYSYCHDSHILHSVA